MINYKILRIVPLHQTDTVIQHYQNNKLSEFPYEKALDSLRKAALLYPSSFKTNMAKLGWEVFEVVPKLQELQTKWADENGLICDCTKNGWLEKIFLKQVSVFKPDVIYFERGNSFTIFSDDFRRQLKKNYPFIKAIVGTCGNVGFDPRQYRDVDLLFAINSVFQAEFEQAGIRSRILHHCFDEEILNSIPHTLEKNEDFVFLGSSGYGYIGHKERYLDLIWLMENSNLKSWCFESATIARKAKIRAKLVYLLGECPLNIIESISQWSKKTPKAICRTLTRILEDAIRSKNGAFFDDWYFNLSPLNLLFPDRCFEPHFGLDYYALMSKAKIVLNRHVDAKIHYGNIRTFEVCGMGGCLLTDRGLEMQHLFELDQEMVSYSTMDECLEKAKFLLNNDSIRAEISRKGKERALKDHTFKSRAKVIDTHLRELL